MDEREVTSAELATHFGVQPPSVNGWRKTGRIDKSKLPELARYLRKEIGYFIDQNYDAPKVPTLPPVAAVTPVSNGITAQQHEKRLLTFYYLMRQPERDALLIVAEALALKEKRKSRGRHPFKKKSKSTKP